MDETCTFCGAEYHRIEDHCCHCTSLLQQLAAMTEERDELVGANMLNRNALKIAQEKLTAGAEMLDKLHKRADWLQEQLAAMIEKRDEWRRLAKTATAGTGTVR